MYHLAAELWGETIGAGDSAWRVIDCWCRCLGRSVLARIAVFCVPRRRKAGESKKSRQKWQLFTAEPSSQAKSRAVRLFAADINRAAPAKCFAVVVCRTKNFNGILFRFSYYFHWLPPFFSDFDCFVCITIKLIRMR